MKIIKRGSGNHISKIEACCKYCNSMLEFYLNIGDKRVTDKDHSRDSRVRYICPVCGERNEILNLYYIKKDRGVYSNGAKYTETTMPSAAYNIEVENLKNENVELSKEDIDWLNFNDEADLSSPNEK